jgi:hypothetical protein
VGGPPSLKSVGEDPEDEVEEVAQVLAFGEPWRRPSKRISFLDASDEDGSSGLTSSTVAPSLPSVRSYNASSSAGHDQVSILSSVASTARRSKGKKKAPSPPPPIPQRAQSLPKPPRPAKSPFRPSSSSTHARPTSPRSPGARHFALGPRRSSLPPLATSSSSHASTGSLRLAIELQRSFIGTPTPPGSPLATSHTVQRRTASSSSDGSSPALSKLDRRLLHGIREEGEDKHGDQAESTARRRRSGDADGPDQDRRNSLESSHTSTSVSDDSFRSVSSVLPPPSPPSTSSPPHARTPPDSGRRFDGTGCQQPSPTLSSSVDAIDSPIDTLFAFNRPLLRPSRHSFLAFANSSPHFQFPDFDAQGAYSDGQLPYSDGGDGNAEGEASETESSTVYVAQDDRRRRGRLTADIGRKEGRERARPVGLGTDVK